MLLLHLLYAPELAFPETYQHARPITPQISHDRQQAISNTQRLTRALTPDCDVLCSSTELSPRNCLLDFTASYFTAKSVRAAPVSGSDIQ